MVRLSWGCPGVPVSKEAIVNEKPKEEVKTTVATLTKADVRHAILAGSMTEEEERYVRIRFGISESGNAPLTMRGNQFAQTRARLAMIEASMLGNRPSTPLNPVKDKIIEKLRRS